MAAPRWTRRPEGSTWGDFGPDDERGRLNLIDAAAVLRGVRSVTEGRSVCLSLSLDLPGGNGLNPRRHPPRLQPVQRGGRFAFNLPVREVDPHHPQVTDVVNDDRVELFLQYSTQWDSLAHVGHFFDVSGRGYPEPVYYNGWRAGEDIVAPGDPQGRPPGAHRLGIQHLAEQGMQTRGVLVDLARDHGPERRVVGLDGLRRAMEEQGAAVQPGDILCLYTGFADLIVQMAGQPDIARLDASCAVLDGQDPALQRWIADSGIAALVADNFAVEGMPADFPAATRNPCCRLPLHELCLFRLGLPLGELWLLDELARALRALGRPYFLLTAPPLRLPGAVGSPVTPIATL